MSIPRKVSARGSKSNPTMSPPGSDTLKNAQTQYLLFQQEASLVFALNAAGFGAADGPERTTISHLYQLSLLDRSYAVRAMIGQLTMAKLLDYRQTSDKYQALIATAREDFSLAAYTSVDDFEKATMDQANSQMGRMQQNLLNLGQAKSTNDRMIDQRKVTLLALITLGSTFLLAANLISTREEKKPQASPGAADDRVTELTTAAQLIEIAIEHAKTLGARG
jgi:hypothetical protein